MVEKLKNVEGVVATAIENLVVFSYINKTAIFDLAKREMIAEYKTKYNSYFNHIAFGKYIGINAQCPVVIDLETKEIIAKFNVNSIYKKYFLKKSNKSDSDNYADSIWIKDITDKEIICRMSYRISGERCVALCAFCFSTIELLHYDCVEGSGGRCYEYNRQEPQYSFLEYNEDIIKALSDEIKSKKQFPYNERYPLHIWFYNKKYNVAFFSNEILYSYYIDDKGSADVTNKEENDFLAQLGNNEQKLIRENGLTAEVLKYLDPEVVLDGGYFWALDSIERKEKQFNMSFDDVVYSDKVTDEELILYTIGLLETEIEEGIGQYFTVRDEKEIACLIKALQLIGATGTVKVIEKGIKLKKAAKNMFDDEYEELVEKLDEDYVGLAIDYIKKLKGLV